MSRALRFPTTADMPTGMRQLAEQQLGGPAVHRAEQLAVEASAPKPRRRRTDSEHREAVALMQMVRAHERDCPELELFYAVPNGGDRRKATAGKMKAEGQRAGVPDYALPVPRHGFHGLYIELKTATGAPSREQRQWLQRLREQGYRAEVCHGWREAWAVLRDYLDLKYRP